jgi:hypothetical protein
MKLHAHNESRRGSALVLAIMLLLTMMVMSYAFFHVVISSNERLDAGMDDDRAFYLAEAAMFESVQSLRGGGTGEIASEQAPVYFGGGVYWVEKDDLTDKRIRLRITAMAGKGRHALAVILRDESEDDSLFVATLNSKDELVMNADVVVDSFQSSLGDYASQATNATADGVPYANLNGHVRSNLDVVLNARAAVLGDAIPGPGHGVTYGTDAYVDGSDTPAAADFTFPPIVVPSFPPLGSYAASSGPPSVLTAGQYAYDDFTIENGATLTIEGPAEIVVQNFTGAKDGLLLVDATNGPVTIYVENSYTHIKDFEADAVAGSPMALAFMVTASQDIVFPSATNIRGAYYAPEASILFASANECWGSFAANGIEMSNDMNFHFDEDLADYFKADTGQAAGQYVVRAWAEAEVEEIVLNGQDHNVRIDRRDPLLILGVAKGDLPTPTDGWTVAP